MSAGRAVGWKAAKASWCLTGIRPAPRGVPQIEVTFDIDRNGILNVSAKDKETGKEQAIRIEASSNLSKDEIERMKAEAQANAEADNKERERIKKINQADSMIFKTEQMMKEHGDKLSADAKNQVQGALDKLKEAHKSGDIPAIDAAISEMNNVMQTVSQQMYQGAQPGAGAGPQPGAGFQGGAQPGGAQDAGQQGGSDEAQDVDFEEVK